MTILELGGAIIWTVYHVIEAGVKLLIPDKVDAFWHLGGGPFQELTRKMTIPIDQNLLCRCSTKTSAGKSFSWLGEGRASGGLCARGDNDHYHADLVFDNNCADVADDFYEGLHGWGRLL